MEKDNLVQTLSSQDQALSGHPSAADLHAKTLELAEQRSAAVQAARMMAELRK